MEMTKVIVGILIVCFTTFCGYVLAKRYRQRKEFFRQLYELNERFLNEISYYKRPLKEFLNAYPYTGEFSQLIASFLDSVESEREEIFAFFGAEEIDFLSVDEKREIRDYFSMLGRGDSLSQKTFFSAMQNNLLAYKNKSEEGSKRYGDLYIKLGFLFGLGVLILII